MPAATAKNAPDRPGIKSRQGTKINTGDTIRGAPNPPHPKSGDFEWKADALYRIDFLREIRRSHENPQVKRIYEEFLEYPLSPTAMKILHTRYTARSPVPARYDPKTRAEEEADHETKF
ncbi:MAG: iron hydrogenase small subunit [Bacillota bacterium]